MPEDIGTAIPYIKRIIEAFNIPILKVDGFEADDVIGTLAQRGRSQGFEVFMMTPDKDYCQLVHRANQVYRPAFMGNAVEVLDVPKVLESCEIERVEQVTDILGLQGDAVDNIPGIPGIGEKTAKTLIQAVRLRGEPDCPRRRAERQAAGKRAQLRRAGPDE